MDRKRIQKIANLLLYYLKLISHVFSNWGGTIHFVGIFRNKGILFEGIFLHCFFKLCGRRYIYTVHNLLPHNKESSAFYRTIYKFIYRIPDVMLVHTAEMGEILSTEFGVPYKKIRIISIGLNEEIPATEMSRRDARAILGFDEQVPVVLFFGRIDKYKGLPLLLDAFESLTLQGVQLVVAGMCIDQEYEMHLRKMVSNNNRGKDIRLDIRLIPDSEVEPLFKAADVLCLPYTKIYQSGLIFLAARFGTPVVATNVGSLAKYVTTESGLITATNDSLGIQRALEEFFREKSKFVPEKIRQLGERFRWSVICSDLITLYEQRGTTMPS